MMGQDGVAAAAAGIHPGAWEVEAAAAWLAHLRMQELLHMQHMQLSAMQFGCWGMSNGELAYPPPEEEPVVLEAVEPETPIATTAASDEKTDVMLLTEPLKIHSPLLLQAPTTIATANRSMGLKWTAEEGGLLRVVWPVDARRLGTKDRQLVSPRFEVPAGGIYCRLMLMPKEAGLRKGERSFLKARGRGHLQLKCESEVPESTQTLELRLAIAKSDSEGWGGLLGPVEHDFGKGAVASLPQPGSGEWDLRAAVDSETQTIAVCLEVAALSPTHTKN